MWWRSVSPTPMVICHSHSTIIRIQQTLHNRFNRFWASKISLIETLLEQNTEERKNVFTFFSIPKVRRPCCKRNIGDFLIFWSVASKWHRTSRKLGKAARRKAPRFMITSISWEEEEKIGLLYSKNISMLAHQKSCRRVFFVLVTRVSLNDLKNENIFW